MPKPKKNSKRVEPRVRRVVFSGGPAAGKTAVLDVLRRHLAGQVVVVPESATMLFTGGFPRPGDPAGRRLVQQAIFNVQRSLEEIHALANPNVPHVCDRGALDGAAYWPGGLDRFLGAMGTTLESEYRRYDAVIFLETSAYGEATNPAENPFRRESPAQARRVDKSLRNIWGGHPNFHVVGHESNFYEKVAVVLITLHRVLGIGAAQQSVDRRLSSTGRTHRASAEKVSSSAKRGRRSTPSA